MSTVFSFKKLIITALVVTSLVAILYPAKIEAAVTNPTAESKISFTFDDGSASNITNVAPVLSQYGYTGTAYITTSCVGLVTVPNNCQADEGIPYMTWAQIKSLQSTYNWEIGAHSVSHPLMTEINANKLEREVANSKAALSAQGINATAFATPYGDYNDKVLSAIAKYYTSHRGFADTGYNSWPYSNYFLRVQQVQYGVSVETVKSYIDRAVADNTWLILVFHDVQASPSTDPEDYQYATADLGAIAAYAKQVGLPGTNISDGLVTGDPSDNLIDEPVSGGSIGNGWSTDSPANVTVDSSSNGSAPESTTSVAVTSNPNTNVHLFSPIINVDPTAEYVVKGYAGMAANQINDIGFYIDEYDLSGNWISGQYMQTIFSWYTRDISFAYKPSSGRVAGASLQIIISTASGKVVYVDSIKWLTVVAGSTPPPPPPETVENILSDGSFMNGFSGWSTDNSSAISLDTGGNGHGTETTNSVLLTNVSERNSQLFSEKVSVSFGSSYTISAYLNMVSFSQDIGFYVDEYDVNGNWISGQYLATKRDGQSGNTLFNYSPISVNVASASLQVIMVAGSGTRAYIDDIQWVTA